MCLLEMEELVRRCCVCMATEKNGKRFRGGFYHEEGYVFSDTFLSKECAENFYGAEFDELFNSGKWKFEKCLNFEDIRG